MGKNKKIWCSVCQILEPERTVRRHERGLASPRIVATMHHSAGLLGERIRSAGRSIGHHLRGRQRDVAEDASAIQAATRTATDTDDAPERAVEAANSDWEGIEVRLAVESDMHSVVEDAGLTEDVLKDINGASSLKSCLIGPPSCQQGLAGSNSGEGRETSSIDPQEAGKGAWDGRTRSTRRAYVEDHESDAEEPSGDTPDSGDGSEDDYLDDYEDGQSMEEPGDEELDAWDWIGAAFEARAMGIGKSKAPGFNGQY